MKNLKSCVCSSVLVTLLAGGLISSAIAAEVPEGTKLADVQEIVKGNGAEPASLDPHKIEGVPESNILRDLMEGLIIQDGDGKLIPGVAESWETADNTTFTFKLRKDAKWSNGDPVTAGDFVYSFQRAVDKNTASPYGWYLEMTAMKNAAAIIKGEKAKDTLGVKAVDDHTLEITLEQALPYFPNMVAHTTMLPVHKATVEKHGDKWTSPKTFVSNGAYKLSDWIVNEKIEMSRNDNYWNNDKTVINKVTYLPIESQTTDMNRFLAGEVTMTYEIPNEHFKRLQKEQPESLKITPRLCSYYYAFNNKKAPFDDVRIRTALSYAIDRDIITKFVTGTGEMPAYNFAHRQVAGLKVDMPEYSKITQEERITKAKELLKEAGFGDENKLGFTLLYNTNDNHKKIAIAVVSMWKKALGIEVKLENQEWKTYLANRRSGNYEVTRAAWCGDYNEASTFLSLLQSNNSSNDMLYKSDNYDAQMKAALDSTSDSDRADNYRKAEAQLAIDMPVAPIYHYVNVRLVKPTLGGYPMNNAEDNLYAKDMYMIAE